MSNAACEDRQVACGIGERLGWDESTRSVRKQRLGEHEVVEELEVLDRAAIGREELTVLQHERPSLRTDALRMRKRIVRVGKEGLAERVHVTVTATAPDLSPKTWYGMPAYENADGKVVLFYQDSGKFNYRYSTLGFQDTANLDDGDLWPTSYALQRWSPEVEKKVIELVKAAVSGTDA